MKTKTLGYSTQCGRCGQEIQPDEEVVYIPFRGANPLLQGKKNPRAFHIDVYCHKKENNANDN